MISVIIPVYNNQNTLFELTEQLIETLKNYGVEIIYINDGSKDQSAEILNQLSDQNPMVKVIHLAKNFGQHPAISAGLEHATGEILILMDADLEDIPSNIPKLIQSIERGNDICFTIKIEAKKFTLNKLLSKSYHILIDSLLKEKNPTNLGTFRAFNKKVLNALLMYPERNILYGPLMHHLGFKREFILVERNTKYKYSSYTLNKRIQLAINSLISYSDLPHRIFLWMGSLIFLLSTMYGLISFIQYIYWGKQLMSGLTLVIMILLIILSLNNFKNYHFK